MKLKDEEINNWAIDYSMERYPHVYNMQNCIDAQRSFCDGMKKARELYEEEISQLHARLDRHEIRY